MWDKKSIKNKTKEFWEKYEAKIVIIIGFLLISAISFEFGMLYGQKWQQKPLIIEKIAESGVVQESVIQNTPEAQNLAPEEVKGGQGQKVPPQSCTFVGSKNSNKYHLPTCRWAKQIKPENIICFKSAEDAISKNYQPDSSCIK